MTGGRREELGIVWAIAWLAGAIDGLLSAVTTPLPVRRQIAAEKWKRQWRRWVKNIVHEPAQGERALPLKRMLAGKSRGQIIALLGRPPATSAQPRGDATGLAAYWHAEVWYYPLDRTRRHAVAITFARDVAWQVEHLRGPTL